MLEPENLVFESLPSSYGWETDHRVPRSHEELGGLMIRMQVCCWGQSGGDYPLSSCWGKGSDSSIVCTRGFLFGFVFVFLVCLFILTVFWMIFFFFLNPGECLCPFCF